MLNIDEAKRFLEILFFSTFLDNLKTALLSFVFHRLFMNREGRSNWLHYREISYYWLDIQESQLDGSIVDLAKCYNRTANKQMF
jgi:hypothetical protein